VTSSLKIDSSCARAGACAISEQNGDGCIYVHRRAAENAKISLRCDETLRKLRVLCGSAVNASCPSNAGVDLGNLPLHARLGYRANQTELRRFS